MVDKPQPCPCQAFSGVHDKHPVRKEIVDAVNANKDSKWVAEDPAKNIFANKTLKEIKGLMGLKGHSKVKLGAMGTTINVGDIPEAFDARSKWPSCTKSIRDQAQCGSCWAFAAAETLTDNLCVLGKTDTPVLSPQDLVSCDDADHGCNGGTLPSAWDYVDEHGAHLRASNPCGSDFS